MGLFTFWRKTRLKISERVSRKHTHTHTNNHSVERGLYVWRLYRKHVKLSHQMSGCKCKPGPTMISILLKPWLSTFNGGWISPIVSIQLGRWSTTFAIPLRDVVCQMAETTSGNSANFTPLLNAASTLQFPFVQGSELSYAPGHHMRRMCPLPHSATAGVKNAVTNFPSAQQTWRNIQTPLRKISQYAGGWSTTEKKTKSSTQR